MNSNLLYFTVFIALALAMYALWKRLTKPTECDHIYSIYQYTSVMRSNCQLCNKEHPDSGKYRDTADPATPFAMGGDD